MNKLPILLIILFTNTVVSVHAQQWQSELYTSNSKVQVDSNFYTGKFLQDFSYAGYHRGEKEIPSVQKNVIDVTKAPYRADKTGNTDVTLILQRAIDDAAKKGGGVVFLPAGVYKLSPTDKDYCLLIDHSNIVLRGDGPGKTFLYNSSNEMRRKSIIKVAGGKSWTFENKEKQSITRDLLQPTKIIPVKSTTSFKVGDLIIVRNYIDNNWIEKHQMTEYWKDDGEKLRGLMYCREIVSINAATNEITIDIPIRYTLEMAHNAAVYKVAPMVTEVGLEGFSIGNRQSFIEGDWTESANNKPESGPYQCDDSWAIVMEQVCNGWIQNVASYQPAENTSTAHLLSNGIKLTQTKNVSLVNCDFHNPQFGGGGGNGYMYRIMSNETLVKNCIADFNRHGFVVSGMNASGNVFYQCSDKNSGKQTGLTGNEKTNGSGSDHHMHFSHSNLYDKCVVENSFFAAGWRKWGSDPIHGLTAAHSTYWNLVSNGTQKFSVETQQSRYGYVIGTSGNKPTVRTSEWLPGTAAITDPVDYVEGVGKGETLVPQSLYSNQLSRRLGGK
jgi:hypothetical protein